MNVGADCLASAGKHQRSVRCGAKALLTGSITRDRISSVKGDRHTLGGAPLHAAEAYAETGTPFAIATAASVDLIRSAGALLPLETQLSWQASSLSTGFQNHYQADGRRTQSIVSLADPLVFDPALLNEVGFVHLSPLHHDDLDTRWYQIDRPVGLDLQGLLRPSRIGVVEPELRRDLLGLLPKVAVLKASEREWSVLLSGIDMPETAFLGAYPEMELLISNGHRGGRAISRARRVYRWRLASLDEVVDPDLTTGAGDLLLAGYLAYRFGAGRPLAAAVDGAATLTTRILMRRARGSASS